MRGLLALPVVVILAGCGSTLMKASTEPTNSSADAPATIQTFNDTPTPTPAVNHIGDVVLTTNFDSLAALQYLDPVISTNEFEKPAPGQHFADVLIRACAGPNGTFDVNPYDFALQLPDDTRLQPTFFIGDDAHPELNLTTLQPKQCVQGWVHFATPSKPKAVVVSNGDISWMVP